MSLVSDVCFQVEFFATGQSPARRIPSEYDVSECDREASRNRKP